MKFNNQFVVMALSFFVTKELLIKASSQLGKEVVVVLHTGMTAILVISSNEGESVNMERTSRKRQREISCSGGHYQSRLEACENNSPCPTLLFLCQFHVRIICLFVIIGAIFSKLLHGRVFFNFASPPRTYT